MRKIDFVITGLDYGGAEMQVISIALAIKQLGYSIRVITLTPPVALTEKLLDSGIQVESLGMTNKLLFPKALLRLVKLVRTNETDILHGHMVHANYMARFAKALCRSIKVISSAHNIDEGGKLRELVYRCTDPLSDINTNVSQSAVDRYIKNRVSPASKMRLIYNGIDCNRFFPSNPGAPAADQFTWIAAGRLEPQKDYTTLLKAIKILKDRYTTNFKLKIAGKGHLLGELEQLAKSLDILEHVEFLGVRDDLPRLYNQSHGFVLSSEWEGYGLVVAEAMACGCIPVVTDSGGPKEIVGNIGEVVPIKDPARLAETMHKVMILGQDERARRSAAAVARIRDHFSLDASVKQWVEIYQAL